MSVTGGNPYENSKVPEKGTLPLKTELRHQPSQAAVGTAFSLLTYHLALATASTEAALHFAFLRVPPSVFSTKASFSEAEMCPFIRVHSSSVCLTYNVCFVSVGWRDGVAVWGSVYGG